MLQVLKNWMLPIAMLTGALFHTYISVLGFLTPTLIFCMLFLTFCKISPRHMKFSRLHIWLLLIQLCGSLLVYAVIAPFNAELAQGVLICVLAPTATAAAVITGMLGGNVAFLASISKQYIGGGGRSGNILFLGNKQHVALLGILRLYLPAGGAAFDIAFVGSLAGTVAIAPIPSMVAFRSNSLILHVVTGIDNCHRTDGDIPFGTARSAV